MYFRRPDRELHVPIRLDILKAMSVEYVHCNPLSVLTEHISRFFPHIFIFWSCFLCAWDIFPNLLLGFCSSNIFM